ncbi:MAG: hypothetical protein GF381_04100 [Candidatus Pacebacteria bacterium]|nr:hypothetical protein [Candidatus Paceibacterota bacterium]
MYYSETRKFLELLDTQEAKAFVITGTKGKTSLGLILNHCIRPFFKHIIKIDTTGVYWNNDQISDREESITHFGYPPTVMPGRYLYGLLKNAQIKLDEVAFILEASLTSGVYGTGLLHHNVGILTNVLSDHIDGNRIKSRRDLLALKSFVFRELKPGGTYITSLDGDLTKLSLKHQSLSKSRVKKIGITTNLSVKEAKQARQALDLHEVLLQDQDRLISARQNKCLLQLSALEQDRILSQNCLFAMAAASSCPKLEIDEVSQQLKSFAFPEEYGRDLHYVKDDKDLFIDFAHEIDSLKIRVNKVYQETNVKPHIIIRISPDHSDIAIKKFAQSLLVLPVTSITVYDKIDGFNKLIYRDRQGGVRKVGETADIIESILLEAQPDFKVKKIYQELEALNFNLRQNNFPLVHVYNRLEDVQDMIADQFKLIKS